MARQTRNLTNQLKESIERMVTKESKYQVGKIKAFILLRNKTK